VDDLASRETAPFEAEEDERSGQGVAARNLQPQLTVLIDAGSNVRQGSLQQQRFAGMGGERGGDSWGAVFLWP